MSHISHRLFLFLLLSCIACGTVAHTALSAEQRALSPLSKTIEGQIMVGYQGWFSYPGDEAGSKAYMHWARNYAEPRPDNLIVDMWPSLSEFTTPELKNVPLKTRSGKQLSVYSAANKATVDRHVRWMMDYAIDGAMIQRFVVALDKPNQRHGLQPFFDRVLSNFRTSAERYGRTFNVMYDLSGADRTTADEQAIAARVKADWMMLVDKMQLTASRSYQHQGERPLVGLWGLGFEDRLLTPATALSLMKWFKVEAPERYRASILIGVPINWRTTASNANWRSVYDLADIISPWSVGTLRTDADVAQYYAGTAAIDRQQLETNGKLLLPVVFPGFSWHNLTQGGSVSNFIPRRGGQFMWTQFREALLNGNRTFYAAMFDEIDEGTALFKLAPDASSTPSNTRIVTLNADGHSLPDDWYLQILQKANSALKGNAVLPPLTLPGSSATINATHSFLEHLYFTVLGRASDPAGLATYANYISTPEANSPAAKLSAVQRCQQVISVFFRSSELAARKVPNFYFVTALYNAAFGRKPDPTGLTHWLTQLDSSRLTRDRLADIFALSGEAGNRCAVVVRNQLSHGK